jgi:hypothetical protein
MQTYLVVSDTCKQCECLLMLMLSLLPSLRLLLLLLHFTGSANIPHNCRNRV